MIGLVAIMSNRLLLELCVLERALMTCSVTWFTQQQMRDLVSQRLPWARYREPVARKGKRANYIFWLTWIDLIQAHQDGWKAEGTFPMRGLGNIMLAFSFC